MCASIITLLVDEIVIVLTYTVNGAPKEYPSPTRGEIRC